MNGPIDWWQIAPHLLNYLAFVALLCAVALYGGFSK